MNLYWQSVFTLLHDPLSYFTCGNWILHRQNSYNRDSRNLSIYLYISCNVAIYLYIAIYLSYYIPVYIMQYVAGVDRALFVGPILCDASSTLVSAASSNIVFVYIYRICYLYQ